MSQQSPFIAMSSNHMERGVSLSRVRTRSQTSDKRRHRQSLDLGSTSNHSSNQRITIDDDDDDNEEDEDVQILSPPTFSGAQARSARHNRCNVATPTLDDADLELRLGIHLAVPSQRVAAKGAHNSRISKTATIDLTSGNDDEVILLTSRKRKATQVSPEPSKDIHLTCAICMDVMKEETSTVCGHIFCRSCILGAIQAQKKCPSCRRKLTNVNIHRIYLPRTSR